MTIKQPRNDEGQYERKEEKELSFWQKVGYSFKLAFLSVSFVFLVAIGLFFGGVHLKFYSTTAYAAKEDAVKEVTKTVYERTPVQHRIAGCESLGDRKSEGKQFNKKGVLIVHVNTDGSVDIGKNMINNVRWEAKSVELGFNIYTEEGNDKMADWLYKTEGTWPWQSSIACWQ